MSVLITQDNALGVSVRRLEYLDKYLQSLVDDKKHSYIGFHAMRRGELIFEGNYGVSSPGGSAITGDAIHPMQSVTKPFTATCCAILQEDGLLDFWEPASKYFPEFAEGEKAEIALWHLLCHTSGIDEEAVEKFVGEYLKNELQIEIAEDAAEDDKLDLLMQARVKMGLPEMERGWDAVSDAYQHLSYKAPLAAKTGTQFSYFNMGYAMLSQIVARISGMPYIEFMQKYIFDPLGMKDSHFLLPDEKRSRYVMRDAAFRSGEYMNSEELMMSTHAAGGLKSTLPDLLRFGQMFLNEGTFNGVRIISPASVRLMTTDHNVGVPDSFWRNRYLGANWGFGWDVKNGKKDDLGLLRGERSYNHAGYGGSRLHIDPDAEVVVALYLVEQHEDSACDNQSNAMNVLYSSFD